MTIVERIVLNGPVDYSERLDVFFGIRLSRFIIG